MSLKFNPRSGMFEEPRRKTGRRHYTAGESAAFLGWDVPNLSPDAALYSNLNRMKARCRDVARNNDYVRHALRLFQTNVVGASGYRLQAKHRLKNGKLDNTFNRTLQRRWQRDGKMRHSPTLDGTMSRRDAEALALRTLMVDGECLAILHPGTRANRARFAFQFVDTARLDWQKNERVSANVEIRMGVEINEHGKPLAYHFLNYDPNDYPFGWSPETTRHTRVPAERVIHWFVQEMPGQTRGVPLIAAPALRAHMLQRFEEAVVIGARVAASKMGFYRYDNDAESEAPGEDDGDYELSQEVEPGMFEGLPRGVSLETFDPNYPPANLEEFEKKLLKGIASGLGIDYVSMANDLEGVNYSSLRAGALEQRAIYRGLQEFQIEHFDERIFHGWLGVQEMNPAVTDLPPTKLRKFIEEEPWSFLGRGWPWVDPLKEVTAYEKAIGMRLTSRSRIVNETLGIDYPDLLEEIEADQKAEDRHELRPESAGGPQADPPEAADDGDEEEDDGGDDGNG